MDDVDLAPYSVGNPNQKTESEEKASSNNRLNNTGRYGKESIVVYSAIFNKSAKSFAREDAVTGVLGIIDLEAAKARVFFGFIAREDDRRATKKKETDAQEKCCLGTRHRGECWCEERFGVNKLLTRRSFRGVAHLLVLYVDTYTK